MTRTLSRNQLLLLAAAGYYFYKKRGAAAKAPGADATGAPPPPPPASAPGMPPGWEEFVDPTSGQVYYCNASTGQTQWTKP